MPTIDENISRFEQLLSSVQRDGIDKLMRYIKKSTDFYKAPASTRFHLACTCYLRLLKQGETVDMINTRMDVLNDEVIQKCRYRNIEVRILKNSKANCMVFTTNNRTRREFEVTFLKGSHFRIGSRFLGYKKVMMSDDADFFTDDDPDGRRKRFNIVLDEKDAVNRLLMRMIEYGFDDMPEVQHSLRS